MARVQEVDNTSTSSARVDSCCNKFELIVINFKRRTRQPTAISSSGLKLTFATCRCYRVSVVLEIDGQDWFCGLNGHGVGSKGEEVALSNQG